MCVCPYVTVSIFLYECGLSYSFQTYVCILFFVILSCIVQVVAVFIKSCEILYKERIVLFPVCLERLQSLYILEIQR